MPDYKQMSLFDEYIDDELEENFIEEKDGYTLYQDTTAKEDEFEYKVYDTFGILIARWVAKLDCLSMPTSEYRRSSARQTFFKVIGQEKDRIRKEKIEKAAKEREAAREIAKQKSKHPSYLDDYYDDDDISWYGRGSGSGSYRSYGYGGGYYGGYSYKPKSKSTGFLDKLNKSDTLVIHCEDRSTDMLAQIYQGKGWDVLRDGDIDKEELHQLLQSHDRIVCLGHGTSGGLINKQGFGSVIGDQEAPYLKDKKLFIIWCNADGYFSHHNIGQGQFITGNMPSEVWECRAAGCGDISAQLMLENITYWSKLCADVVERALNGDAQGAVDYVRDKYIKKYGDHPVTIYNAERTKVQGKPLEDLSDRYWGPEELLHPNKANYSSYSHPSYKSSAIKPENDTEAPDDVDESFFRDDDTKDFEIKNGVFLEYRGNNENVVIPTSVTSIGNRAFDGCSSLTSITIPNSVTSIGRHAFYCCKSLTSVIFEAGSALTSIDNFAFSGCKSLTSIWIPNTVTSIGEWAFYGCSSLKLPVVIPTSVTSIGYKAFSYCSSLKKVTISNSIKDIDWETFSNCESLTSITIPNGVARIGNGVFYCCTSLKSITIPNSVTYIGDSAFWGCSKLTSITIPNTVTSIGNRAFKGCSSLQYNEYGNCLYLGNEENPYLVLVKAKNTNITTATISKNTRFIMDSAFCECRLLTSIVIPNNVKSIRSNAFYNCSSLTIYCEASSEPSGWGFNGDWNYGSKRVVWGYDLNPDRWELIEEYKQLNEENMIKETDSLGNELTQEQINFFKNSKVRDKDGKLLVCYHNTKNDFTEFKKEFINIGGAFGNGFYFTTDKDDYQNKYKMITYVNITKPLIYKKTGIEQGLLLDIMRKHNLPFRSNDGKNLNQRVTDILKEEGYDGVIAIDKNDDNKYEIVAFEPNQIKNIENIEPTTSNNINESMLFEQNEDNDFIIHRTIRSTTLIQYKGKDENVIIPDGVTCIGCNAFWNKHYVTSVTIPDGVEIIGAEAFAECSSLISITIPNSIKSIGNDAFASCSSLTSIEIPNSVAGIGNGAFVGCTSLTSVNIPNTIKYIGDAAFLGCSKLTSIVIPSSVTNIGRCAFAKCDSLTIYCETDSQPNNWSFDWNSSNCSVIWGYNNHQ